MHSRLHIRWALPALRGTALPLLFALLFGLPRWVGGEDFSGWTSHRPLPAIATAEATILLLPACRDKHDADSAPGGTIIALSVRIPDAGVDPLVRTYCERKTAGPLVQPATLTITHSSYL